MPILSKAQLQKIFRRIIDVKEELQQWLIAGFMVYLLACLALAFLGALYFFLILPFLPPQTYGY